MDVPQSCGIAQSFKLCVYLEKMGVLLPVSKAWLGLVGGVSYTVWPQHQAGGGGAISWQRGDKKPVHLPLAFTVPLGNRPGSYFLDPRWKDRYNEMELLPAGHLFLSRDISLSGHWGSLPWALCLRVCVRVLHIRVFLFLWNLLGQSIFLLFWLKEKRGR